MRVREEIEQPYLIALTAVNERAATWQRFSTLSVQNFQAF